MTEERLQKILAAAGYGSRRACELLIDAGKVRVNGKLAKLGDKADAEKDAIMVDGKLLRGVQKKVYIAIYKPRRYLSDFDENFPKPTVLDLIDVPEQIFPVGRLDFDSEGLVLMTNDGELANRLTHPRYEHEKEYEVLVNRMPDEEQLSIWRRGVVLEDGYRTRPASVEIINKVQNGVWLRITLKEGKKRQIRVTGLRIGLPVKKIKRVRIGTLTLGNLKPKEWRYLTDREVETLRKYVGFD
jgi:23S rRNA pseudouridine2605 synthase